MSPLKNKTVIAKRRQQCLDLAVCARCVKCEHMTSDYCLRAQYGRGCFVITNSAFARSFPGLPQLRSDGHVWTAIFVNSRIFTKTHLRSSERGGLASINAHVENDRKNMQEQIVHKKYSRQNEISTLIITKKRLSQQTPFPQILGRTPWHLGKWHCLFGCRKTLNGAIHCAEPPDACDEFRHMRRRCIMSAAKKETQFKWNVSLAFVAGSFSLFTSNVSYQKAGMFLVRDNISWNITNDEDIRTTMTLVPIAFDCIAKKGGPRVLTRRIFPGAGEFGTV